MSASLAQVQTHLEDSVQQCYFGAFSSFLLDEMLPRILALGLTHMHSQAYSASHMKQQISALLLHARVLSTARCCAGSLLFLISFRQAHLIHVLIWFWWENFFHCYLQINLIAASQLMCKSLRLSVWSRCVQKNSPSDPRDKSISTTDALLAMVSVSVTNVYVNMAMCLCTSALSPHH